MTVDARLKKMGVVLPAGPASAANYTPYMASNGLLYVSGQLPMKDGAILHPGRLGAEISLEEGQAAARLCAINILAQVKAALDGDWSRLRRCVRLGVFVAATPEFAQHPQVANGASDLIAEILGEIGRHTRAAVGVASLPLGAAVEVDAVFEIEG